MHSVAHRLVHGVWFGPTCLLRPGVGEVLLPHLCFLFCCLQNGCGNLNIPQGQGTGLFQRSVFGEWLVAPCWVHSWAPAVTWAGVVQWVTCREPAVGTTLFRVD
jgi:hypothetical protein